MKFIRILSLFVNEGVIAWRFVPDLELALWSVPDIASHGQPLMVRPFMDFEGTLCRNALAARKRYAAQRISAFEAA